MKSLDDIIYDDIDYNFTMYAAKSSASPMSDDLYINILHRKHQ